MLHYRRPQSQTVFRLLTCLSLGLNTQMAQADLVKLNNGGELRGKIISDGSTKQRIQLETTTGAVVVVERDQTQLVTMRPSSVEEYETRARRFSADNETWEAHWELAEWCKQRSLTKQREIHLRRVTELSPEHERAQQALGRVWHQGHWVDRDELMASKGYVKYKSRYITTQELEAIEKNTEETQRERTWYTKIRLWHGWLDGSNSDRARQGMIELNGLTDPNAAAAVIKFVCPDPRSEIRELSVRVLIKIGGEKSFAGLVKMTLFDESPEVRAAAIEGIGRDHYQRAQVAFIQGLRSDQNSIVCHAAAALGRVGDKNSVPPLIEALITVHTYQVVSDVPLHQTYTFNADGSQVNTNQSLPPSVIAAVRTGQMNAPIIVPSEVQAPRKTVTVRVEQYNAEALASLEKITEQDFGYDKRAWNLWWNAEKNQGGKQVK